MGAEDWKKWFTGRGEGNSEARASRGAEDRAGEKAFIRDAETSSLEAQIAEKESLLKGIEESLQEITERVAAGQAKAEEHNLGDLALKIEAEIQASKKALLADRQRLLGEIQSCQTQLAGLQEKEV